MSTFKNIVVPVDFSETSAEAWRVACEIAEMAGSRLHVLHVTPQHLQETWAAEAMALDVGAIAREWMIEAQDKLTRIGPTLPIDPARITRTVIAGVAHTRIVGFAAAQRADLIVMGTHGYGPIMHLLLGSVAERVVRHATCPVLTVPHRSLRHTEAQIHPGAAAKV
jgi:nucleotide-binding universal stress UspA family protein